MKMHKHQIILFLLIYNLNVTAANKDQPNFEEGEELQLFDFLTGEGSEYDLRKSPRNFNNNSSLRTSEALTVKTSLFVYFIGNFVPQNMEFETLLLFRHKWRVGKYSKDCVDIQFIYIIYLFDCVYSFVIYLFM